MRLLRTGCTRPLFFIALFTGFIGLAVSNSNADESHVDGATPVRARLTNFWHETITKEDALNRLSVRTLDASKRKEIVANIPEKTEHYLTFEGGMFREYVQFGDGVAELILILPVVERNGTFFLAVPDQVAADETNRPLTIRVTEFASKDGTLIVDGVPRNTFKLTKEAIELKVDPSVVNPAVGALADHPHGSACCDSCEWVHSRLGIHYLDKICCLGKCKQ